MQRKLVIIGAGSAMFTQGLVADMILVGDEWDLHLVDVDPENLSVAHRLAQQLIAHRAAPIKLTATLDRRQSLPGADVVVCTFGVGGRRAWEQDVFVPRTFGIFQPVGDSVMPGGISRAMRQIPIAVGIAQDMVELCPHALLINYANPMSAIVRAIGKTTDLNVLGLCHGVNHVQEYLAAIAGVPAGEVGLNAIGVNHCTWITDIRHRGRTLWPAIEQVLAEHPAQLPDKEDPFAAAAPFSWELYRLHGAFPAVLDRHVTEFYPALCRPGAYYGRTLGVDAFSLEGTIRAGDEIFAEMAAVASGEQPLDEDVFSHAPGEHEQLVTILACLAGRGSGVFSVNLPNNGRDVRGGGKIIGDRVEKRLDAFVPEGRPAENGDEFQIDRCGANGAFQFRQVDFLFCEVFVHDPVIFVRQSLHKHFAILGRFLQKIVGNRKFLESSTQGFILPLNGLHSEKVNDTAESVLRSPG
jgi:alpha-galactosidase